MILVFQKIYSLLKVIVWQNDNKDLNLINFKKHHSIFTIAFSLYLYLTPFRLQQGDIDEDVLLLIIKKVLLGASIFFQRSKS